MIAFSLVHSISCNFILKNFFCTSKMNKSVTQAQFLATLLSVATTGMPLSLTVIFTCGVVSPDADFQTSTINSVGMSVIVTSDFDLFLDGAAGTARATATSSTIKFCQLN